MSDQSSSILTMVASDFHYPQIRNGLFLAASRTYAEQYIEPLIRAKYGLLEPVSNDHDAIGSNGKKYEIKACKVLRSSENRAGTKSLIERILYENLNTAIDRLVPFADRGIANYDANVQNVKRDHFDLLIYVLLFEDCIKVFQAESADISVGQFMGWSDKHGRYDELGKSGQFMLTKSTIEWHLDHHLIDTLTYQKAAELYEQISSEN